MASIPPDRYPYWRRAAVPHRICVATEGTETNNRHKTAIHNILIEHAHVQSMHLSGTFTLGKPRTSGSTKLLPLLPPSKEKKRLAV